MSRPRREGVHGSYGYSRGCRCRTCRADRRDSTRRRRELAGFQAKFDIDRWVAAAYRRARDADVGINEYLEARGVDARRYLFADNPPRVIWTTLDRLCCAIGIPTASLYPEFASRDLAA